MAQKTSVIICAYNYARFLPQCLESVLGQTQLPNEIIVVDDGSTDDTPEVVRRFAGVRYIRQLNAGKAAAFNRGFEAASGDLICHLDADDYWMPQKLERVLQAFQAFPSAGGLLHEVLYVDAHGQTLYPHSSDHSPALYSLREVLLSSFVYSPLCYRRRLGAANSICVWRESVEDLCPLPHRLGLSVDGALIAAAARQGLLCWPEVLSAYRHHGANQFACNPSSLLYQVALSQWLLHHPHFGERLPRYERDLLDAKLMEDTMLCCRHNHMNRLAGFWAGVRLWWLLRRQRTAIGWKHVIIPFFCLIRMSPGRWHSLLSIARQYITKKTA